MTFEVIIWTSCNYVKIPFMLLCSNSCFYKITCIMFRKINWGLVHMINMFPGQHGEVKIRSKITSNNNSGMFSLYFKTLIELSWRTTFINIIIMLLFLLVWWLFISFFERNANHSLFHVGFSNCIFPATFNKSKDKSLRTKILKLQSSDKIKSELDKPIYSLPIYLTS